MLEIPGSSIFSLIRHKPFTFEIELSPTNLGAEPSFFTTPNLPAAQCGPNRFRASSMPAGSHSAKPSFTSDCTSANSRPGSSRPEGQGSSHTRNSSGGRSATSISRQIPEGGIVSSTPVGTPKASWSGSPTSVSDQSCSIPLSRSSVIG